MYTIIQRAVQLLFFGFSSCLSTALCVNLIVFIRSLIWTYLQSVLVGLACWSVGTWSAIVFPSSRKAIKVMLSHAVAIAACSYIVFVHAGSCVRIDLSTTSHKCTIWFVLDERCGLTIHWRRVLQKYPEIYSGKLGLDTTVHYPVWITRRSWDTCSP